MTRIALTVLIALSTVVVAAPPQAGSVARDHRAAATTSLYSSRETNLPFTEAKVGEEHSLSVIKEKRQNYAQGDAPWGNGLPPAVTIQAGMPYTRDPVACSTNYQLLTKMIDGFMVSVSKSRARQGRFDNHRPTLGIVGGACVTTRFVGYADGLPMYQPFPQNGGSWGNDIPAWQPAPQTRPYPTQTQSWQPQDTAWQPPPQNQPYFPQNQPKPPQSEPYPLQFGPGSSEFQPYSPQSMPQPRPKWQNQPSYPNGNNGRQPYTATVTIYPDQSQYQG